MATDAGHHDRSITDPGILANGNARILPRLLANRDVRPFDAVLPIAVNDGNMRTNQHIFFDGYIANHTANANIGRIADGSRRMREYGAEGNAGLAVTVRQYQAIKSPAQIDPQCAW